MLFQWFHGFSESVLVVSPLLVSCAALAWLLLDQNLLKPLVLSEVTKMNHSGRRLGLLEGRSESRKVIYLYITSNSIKLGTDGQRHALLRQVSEPTPLSSLLIPQCSINLLLHLLNWNSPHFSEMKISKLERISFGQVIN